MPTGALNQELRYIMVGYLFINCLIFHHLDNTDKS